MHTLLLYTSVQGRSQWSGHGWTGFWQWPIKFTSSIKLINFQIYSFCSFVDFEINSARLEFILSLSSLIVG